LVKFEFEFKILFENDLQTLDNKKEIIFLPPAIPHFRPAGPDSRAGPLASPLACSPLPFLLSSWAGPAHEPSNH
jgi:hypothetical protein